MGLEKGIQAFDMVIIGFGMKQCLNQQIMMIGWLHACCKLILDPTKQGEKTSNC